MIEQYTAVALQPTMRGVKKRSEIATNLKHISEMIEAAIWLSGCDLPVRLIAIPEGALQGFTDEIFDWDHRKYVDEIAIDIPGEETDFLGRKCKEHGTYIIAQAKVKDPDFPERYFNCAFIIDDKGKFIHRHYKLQVCTPVENSTVPHDVWDKWIELHGCTLDSFYRVTHTDIGRIGTLICFEGCFPETARGLAMNGAELIFRCSNPEPYVSIGMWELQNRARALDNTCYVVAPNVATYYLDQESTTPIDVFGGHSMIIDYQGRKLCDHQYGAGSSYAAAAINIEALREYRSRSMVGNWLNYMRTEQYRLIYDQPLYPKNLYLESPPAGHAEAAKVLRKQARCMQEKGMWEPSFIEQARERFNVGVKEGKKVQE